MTFRVRQKCPHSYSMCLYSICTRRHCTCTRTHPHTHAPPQSRRFLCIFSFRLSTLLWALMQRGGRVHRSCRRSSWAPTGTKKSRADVPDWGAFTCLVPKATPPPPFRPSETSHVGFIVHPRNPVWAADLCALTSVPPWPVRQEKRAPNYLSD